MAPFARRAPRISQADVFRAADELLVEGHRPTIDRVRMRLGRGSPNTINDHLDDWWAKLGSRLRDVPGHEFPQLPERIGRTLQQLWNEALDGAREVLQGTLAEREQTFDARERALEILDRQLDERDQATVQRAAALEDSLALAREQLAVANQRAERLETTLQERAAECVRLSGRIEPLETIVTELRTKLEASAATHQAERARLEERHAATEKHWLTEVDRARQLAKEAAIEHERQIKELRGQTDHLQAERDQLRQQLQESRSEIKTAVAVREQLEERLRAWTRISQTETSSTKSKPKSSSKRRRLGRHPTRTPAS